MHYIEHSGYGEGDPTTVDVMQFDGQGGVEEYRILAPKVEILYTGEVIKKKLHDYPYERYYSLHVRYQPLGEAEVEGFVADTSKEVLDVLPEFASGQTVQLLTKITPEGMEGYYLAVVSEGQITVLNVFSEPEVTNCSDFDTNLVCPLGENRTLNYGS